MKAEAWLCEEAKQSENIRNWLEIGKVGDHFNGMLQLVSLHLSLVSLLLLLLLFFFFLRLFFLYLKFDSISYVSGGALKTRLTPKVCQWICGVLEHPYQMFYKKCHFVTSKTYFIILPHHFTTSYLSDILSFNSIH